MKKEKVTAWSQFALACIFLAAGVFMIVAPRAVFSLTEFVLKIGFTVLSVYELVLVFVNKRNRGWHILFSIIYSATVTILFVNPTFILALLPEVLGLISIIHGITRLLTNYQYRQDHVAGSTWHLIAGILFLIGGISLMISPVAYTLTIARVFGVYFVLMSVNAFSDFFIAISPRNRAYNHKRKFRIALPVFIAAFLPQRVLSIIRKLSSKGDVTYESASGDAPDLEVFIHLLKGGMSAFGHADICFDGKIYSYGCYDGTTDRIFGMMSDGTLVIANRESYLKHCLDFEKKVLVGFGISLTAEQKDAVRAKINEMMKNAVPWLCKLQVDPTCDAHESASELYRATKNEFYKFKSGAFKTYFVLNTNCVLLADSLIGAAGI
ncbi:MAG: DUF308 domain-containing protein, partial [Clostridia bacterium]